MNTSFQKKVNYAILFIALIGAIIIIILQIYNANNTTKVETTLYNILQFIFSITFSWLITKLVTFEQFKNTQKQFAFSAFRRIKEIEGVIDRLHNYVISKNTSETNIEVIHNSLIDARSIIRNSIADWSDIIGDEIATTNEIERLEKIKIISPEVVNSKYFDKTREVELKLSELRSNLPSQLQQIYRRDPLILTDDQFNMLYNNYLKNNGLRLDAFWDKDDSFTGNINYIKKGNPVLIARSLTIHRSNPYIVFDMKEDSLGVITNAISGIGEFEAFTSLLDEYFEVKPLPVKIGGKPIKAKIIDVEPFDKKSNRKYFTIHIDVKPSKIFLKHIENI